ncbi:Thiol-disulfide oxidoreductase ResA [Planctomycetes bacterium MalM25]|nr:Thiol-disulfide oxidoreductase ResA [Planctomycetes bacterium MalM25]
MSRLAPRVAGLAAVFALGASAALAQGYDSEDETITLPSDPRLWHNSPPLSLDSLEGKGVVFYFFEEESPAVAQQWPSLLAQAKTYEGKPILFVGVNSGSDPRVLKRYLASYRVNWPVIHDYDRSLESAMGLPKLSTATNVFAVTYLSGEGTRGDGKGADFAATAEAALKGASWKVDPAAIPRPLMSAWRDVELGDYKRPARALNRAAKTKDESEKTAADQLLSVIEKEATAVATQAAEALKSNDNWAAYKHLDTMLQRFDGYEFPILERAETKHDELAKTDPIKDELSAAKLLNKAVATGSKGTPSAVKRAKGVLRRLIADHPSSEAAAKAQEYLATLDG